jgi:PhnB protein
MVAPVPYLHFPGTASRALHDYQRIFGGELLLHTFADFSRDDGSPELIAHGELHGPVNLFAADAGEGDTPLAVEGLLFSLLGAADPARSHAWFDALAATGAVLDPLQERPWGAHDGQVRDAHGVTWLIGYEPSA